MMRAGKRILTSGVFDLFHIGHLRYLQYAKKQGDYLIVGVVADEDVWRTKAKWPAIPLAQRMEIIAGMAGVDEVRVQPSSTRDVAASMEWIPAWGPDHVVVGGMWNGSESWSQLQRLLAERGISVSYAAATDGISSTELVAGIRRAKLAREVAVATDGVAATLEASTADWCRPQARHVLAMGVFDLFHIGHLRYLQYARAQGQHLSVAVCTDLISHKLKNRWPVIDQFQRLEIIRGLASVTRADLLPASTEDPVAAVQWMLDWGIDHVEISAEQASSARWAGIAPLLAERAISVAIAPATPEQATSNIIRRIRALDAS